MDRRQGNGEVDVVSSIDESRAPSAMTVLYDRIAPGGSWREIALAVVALIAAGPSLVWAFDGAALMHDDWWLATSFANGDLGYRWDQLWVGATSAPARPGGALYYALSYGLFGATPALHALLLAAVNAVLGVLVFVVAERLWRTPVAFWIAMVYAALPNRGSTRLWFAVANYPFALILVLLGVMLFLGGRPLAGGLVLGISVLTYEGVAGLAGLAVIVWILGDLAKRWRAGLVAVVPVVASAALLFVLSPKRNLPSGGARFDGTFDRLLSSQFGSGPFEWSAVAGVMPLVVLVSATVVIGWPREKTVHYRQVLIWGIVILFAGWAPFVATHWPISTDGFFDRANGVVGLATAVVFGVLLAYAADVVPARLGAIFGGFVIVGFLALNSIDVRAFQESAEQGRRLLDQVLVDVGPTSTPIRIVPPPEAVGGVAQFATGSNLSDAVVFERGDRVTFYVIPAVEETPVPADRLCYDRLKRVVGACGDGW